MTDPGSPVPSGADASPIPTRAALDATICRALEDAGLVYERTAEAAFLVTLPGAHKLATRCWLVAGEHALLVEAFVLRRPDEHHREVYELLLKRNARMYGVAWSLDALGDVFLVGRRPLSSITDAEVDRLLGSVLSYADEAFDALLEIGFGSSIKREWEWRQRKGESTDHLAAFAHFADPERG